jgi:type IV secretory pathway component VirB8
VTPKNRRRRLWLVVGWFMLAAGLTAFVVVVLLPGWSGD